MAKQAEDQSYKIDLWTPEHDATDFSSGMASIDKYIKSQVQRDVSSRASLVFVHTEPENKIIRAYYSLSAIGLVFAELPEKVQKKLPRYPQVGATLLGRLGVDQNYRTSLLDKSGEKPRLCEHLLVDAQWRTLQGATTTAGAALMLIYAERPADEELASGILDPLTFYTQYGFAPLPSNERRLFKLTRVIEREFSEAGLI
ncbi:MAG: hypothetical protein K2X77_24330 [Candidatus Obscuribacterales bacterium]|nr:hypothetical protein [Candidatus Obscuribacterales bacterium]